MRRIFFLAVAVAALAMMATSCKTAKNNLTYFQNIDSVSVTETALASMAVKIEPQDELLITVTSLNPEATAHYNMPLAAAATLGDVRDKEISQAMVQTYTVDRDGDIVFPVLGRIRVQGMTTKGLQQYLTQRIGLDVKDPVVRVSLLNFKVNVMGEVKSPGIVAPATERFTLLDALAAAKDLTEFGLREDVLLIREEDGRHVYHHFNLNDASTLASPYFFLKQNDVVYVSPNKIRQDNSRYNQNSAFKLSVVSTIVSGASVIASLVIALTVK